jgi:hypothetical protein
MSGDGVSLDVAARLVSAFLWPKTAAGSLGVLLIDDAKAVDPSSLDACVAAAKGAVSFGLLARLDATGSPPSVLAAMPRAAERELSLLTREAAEELTGGCTNDALDATARKRWSQLGAGVPLAIVEAVAWGIATGELIWPSRETSGEARPRSRISGRGPAMSAASFIQKRASNEGEWARTLLCLVALLGGEAKLGRLARIFKVAGLRIDVEAMVAELVTRRWLLDTQEDWVSLPSRTHQTALAGLLDVPAKQVLHRATADVIDDEEGMFGRVEGAWHAAQAGDAKRAARTLLAAAAATADAGLEASTTQLIAYARRTDPACEENALELLANALSRTHSLAPATPPQPAAPPPPSVRVIPPPPVARPPSVPPPPMPSRRSAESTRELVPEAPPTQQTLQVEEPDSMVEHALIRGPDEPLIGLTAHDSEPPTLMRDDAMPTVLPPTSRFPPIRSAKPVILGAEGKEHHPVEGGSVPPDPAEGPQSGSNIATRLGELAKEALLIGDNVSLERWVDGLRAAGESPIFTERMRAMARIVRGDIGDALRVLRRTRAQLDPKDHALRCQTSLALGIALSVAGRPQEALLEGMDALARARQTSDERAASACLAFLAKLFTSVGRPEDAEKIRQAST